MNEETKARYAGVEEEDRLRAGAIASAQEPDCVSWM